MEQKRKKYGGRQKGSTNKTTKELKEFVTEFIGSNWNQVQKDFDSKRMKPQDRLSFIERLLRYVIPVQSTSKGSLDIRADIEKLSDEQLEQIMQKLTEKETEKETDDE